MTSVSNVFFKGRMKQGRWEDDYISWPPFLAFLSFSSSCQTKECKEASIHEISTKPLNFYKFSSRKFVSIWELEKFITSLSLGPFSWLTWSLLALGPLCLTTRRSNLFLCLAIALTKILKSSYSYFFLGRTVKGFCKTYMHIQKHFVYCSEFIYGMKRFWKLMAWTSFEGCWRFKLIL